MDEIEKPWLKKKLPKFGIGDTVDVHFKIVEGEKERIQIFAGTVIAQRGHGLGSMVTVRKLVAGEGVERTFPLHSPRVVDIKVTRKGRVRRAKLYYLRERIGRATRVEEQIEKKGEGAAPEAPPAESKAAESKAAAP
jgi:large subunit ribosomal protein L19